ncbi:hypothetical protein [Streptomyces phytohabitans]|uniref:hypothetical protein n=1 Tax=Streptomyces phytohabitans TaxID=1150371 RepID=UPI00345C1A31
MSDGHLYTETSRNPFARLVRLDAAELRSGHRRTPLDELNLPAMADAYLRGGWLGAAGAERPLAHLPEARGSVPVTRVSGSSTLLKPRRAAEFARTLGELAVHRSGGPEEIGRLAAAARAVGVPLWIARRTAPGSHGPVTVAVDRRSARADVWAEGAPTVRLRAPHGVSLDRRNPSRNLEFALDGEPAVLTVETGRVLARDRVTLVCGHRRWELREHVRRSSRLLRDGVRVAVLTRPDRPVGRAPLLPLADVAYGDTEPVDEVVAHALAVAFGLGDSTGTVRFPDHGGRERPGGPELWGEPWFTGVGSGRGDSGPGAADDGWGGGDGGDGGGGDGGGGSDGGGGDSGGGGGGD